MKIRDEAFENYFYFAKERMNIFWNRYKGKNPPFSKDPIFQTYKFTNAYRCLDRVSQYLIKDVIYAPESKKLNEESIILRILLFKIFNKIETWQDIEKGLGGLVTVKSFKVDRVNKILKKRMETDSIFANSYMLTGMAYGRFKGGDNFNHKHERYIQVLNDEMMDPKFIKSVLRAKGLKDIYESFLGITYVAKFLAMQ